jgi:hypothetical protein
LLAHYLGRTDDMNASCVTNARGRTSMSVLVRGAL